MGTSNERYPFDWMILYILYYFVRKERERVRESEEKERRNSKEVKKNEEKTRWIPPHRKTVSSNPHFSFRQLLLLPPQYFILYTHIIYIFFLSRTLYYYYKIFHFVLVLDERVFFLPDDGQPLTFSRRHRN